MITDEMERLGRFGHHPDPAIDFCVEVECLENEIGNHLSGFLNGTPTMSELRERLARAMEFRVGGDEGAVAAKQVLRGVEDRLLSAALPVQAEPVAWTNIHQLEFRHGLNGIICQKPYPADPPMDAFDVPLYASPAPSPREDEDLIAARKAATQALRAAKIFDLAEAVESKEYDNLTQVQSALIALRAERKRAGGQP